MLTRLAESTPRNLGVTLLETTELRPFDLWWWTEFDAACAGRGLTPDVTELLLAYRAKRVSMSPTGALVSIVEQRRRQTLEAA